MYTSARRVPNSHRTSAIIRAACFECAADQLHLRPRRIRQRAEQMNTVLIFIRCEPAARGASPMQRRSEQESDPNLSNRPPLSSGVKSRLTPKASSRSALQRPDAERLPCFATFNPAPATTNAAIVKR